MGRRLSIGLRKSGLPLIALVVALAGCGGGHEPEFSTRIDNPYWPMKPGARWIYTEREGGDVNRVVVEVTDRTKRVASGLTARVVHDVVSRKGEIVEDTLDWYAQRKDGSVWYLGENTKEYENGKVSSTEGSWEDGVDGAKRGLMVPAEPKVGMTYRQEYYPGHAEDKGKVLSLKASASVPAGRYTRMLKTKDFTPLEPPAAEFKYYARGVGPVLSESVAGKGREELVRYSR